METRRVRALVAKTEFVADYGQVVLDAGSKRQELREPVVPVPAIPGLIAKGYIADDIEDDTLADDAAALAEMTGAPISDQQSEPVANDAPPVDAPPAAPIAGTKPPASRAASAKKK